MTLMDDLATLLAPPGVTLLEPAETPAERARREAADRAETDRRCAAFAAALRALAATCGDRANLGDFLTHRLALAESLAPRRLRPSEREEIVAQVFTLVDRLAVPMVAAILGAPDDALVSAARWVASPTPGALPPVLERAGQPLASAITRTLADYGLAPMPRDDGDARHTTSARNHPLDISGWPTSREVVINVAHPGGFTVPRRELVPHPVISAWGLAVVAARGVPSAVTLRKGPRP